MGRYYNGDIEGKFMFSVQSSDDADFFGSEGHSAYLHYHFDKDDHMTLIDEGIKECKITLGSWKKKLDTFFKKNNGWNDEMLKDQINLSPEKSKEILGWYARLELGEQIKKCVKENGSCSFEAEL